MFETIPINQLLTPTAPDRDSEIEPQLLALFDRATKLMIFILLLF